MPSTTHWNCPSCGQLYRLDEPACPVCRITRENRDVIGKTSVVRAIEKEAEDVEVHLPYVIQEARFNIPVPGGQLVWASGALAAGEAGFFLVSDKDGRDPKEVALARPLVPGAIGPTSYFIPAASVVRVVHERLIGYWFELKDRKIPLRLPKEAWDELDLLCDHFGIKHT
ncbi:MAG TPA: hypothetical protein VF950_02340 [Planctomycetota bacterium]